GCRAGIARRRRLGRWLPAGRQAGDPAAWAVRTTRFSRSIRMAMATEAKPIAPGGAMATLRRRLIKALATCATEADFVQVLYAELHPVFGYDVVLLQVLEQEGWLHEVPVDGGVLQDVRRRRVAESHFAAYHEKPRIVVTYATSATPFLRTRGPGHTRRPRTYIWVP